MTYDIKATIISQYANSDRIVALIDYMQDHILPDTDINTFYSFCFDVDTAQGFGLDNLGAIVDISRTWGSVTLNDTDYRVLVLIKALSNISDTSVPSVNAILVKLFGSTGRVYVMDDGHMVIHYVAEFALSEIQKLYAEAGIIPRTSGVSAKMLEVNQAFFGFQEMDKTGTYVTGFNDKPMMGEDSYYAV